MPRTISISLVLLLLLSGLTACDSAPSGPSSSRDSLSTPITQNPGDSIPSIDPPPPPPPPVLGDLGLTHTETIKPQHPDYTWMYDCVQAACSEDYASLQKFMDPGQGLFFLRRSGIVTEIVWFARAEELKATVWPLWVKKIAGSKPALLREKPIYLVEPFRAQPEWVESKGTPPPPLACEVRGRFNYFPDLVNALTEHGFLKPKPDERERMDQVEKLVELELLVDWVYYYFGKVNGQWRLIGLDVARCDFSA